MANLSPEERLQKWLRNHPNADQRKLDKFLAGHDEIAALFNTPPATAAASTPAPPPAAPPTADTGIDSPPPDPTPAPALADDRTPWQKVWDWIKGNPISITADAAYAPLYEKFNLGIWAAAIGVLAWLILRKRKS